MNKLIKNKVPFSEQIIKQINTLVLMVRPEDHSVYQCISVRIMDAYHIPPDPVLVPEQMELLVAEFEGNKRLHLIERAALFHLKFEEIHPFVDSNGRTGQLILYLMLMQAGHPPINVKCSDRKRYYEAFDEYYQNNNPSDCLSLIAITLKTTFSFYN